MALSLFFCCEQSDPIEVSSIIGHYRNIKGAEDYSDLELREDHTYHFNQSKWWSCDIWPHFYGTWDIKNNKVYLYDGIDLDTLIEVSKDTDFSSDTLLITFSEKFIRKFPNLKVRIGLDSVDTPVISNQVVFDKQKSRKKYKERYGGDTDNNFPLQLNIRSDEYFHISRYILEEGRIDFDVGNFVKGKVEKRELVEYSFRDGFLYSKDHIDYIHKHQLRRMN